MAKKSNYRKEDAELEKSYKSVAGVLKKANCKTGQVKPDRYNDHLHYHVFAYCRYDFLRYSF